MLGHIRLQRTNTTTRTGGWETSFLDCGSRERGCPASNDIHGGWERIVGTGAGETEGL